MAGARKVPGGVGTGSSRPPSEPPAGGGLFAAEASTAVDPTDSPDVVEGVLREARQAGPRQPVRSEPALDGPVVLVVDDVDDAREMYALALRAEGFRVLRARDGREAVDMAIAWLPDLIVMDYSMPRMDGVEAMGRIAAHPSTARIPVVMISAYADELPRQARLACAAFLPKPCAGDELARVARLVLEARAPGA